MKIILFLFASLSTFLIFFSCSPSSKGQANKASTVIVYPLTDLGNSGNWKLNTDISDEFEATALDTKKWFIQGTDSIYKSNFTGHAPAQFSTANVRVENGMLKLQTKWEPDFKFSKEYDKKGTKYENFTTAAISSKKQITYGYMEIKCKVPDASITGAFWALGSNTELDIIEHLGRPSLPNKKQLETEFWSSIHDWAKPGGPSVWTHRTQLPFRVADGFHVYACEWDPNFIKFYADGKLIKSATREQVGEGWVITKPVNIWIDSEAFPWHGVPAKEDLPVDYEIEYVRIWQK
jgi:beta-glucanase (GH16 family)